MAWKRCKLSLTSWKMRAMLAGLSEVHPQLRRKSSGLTRSQLSDSRQPVLPRQSSPSGIHPTKSEQGASNAGLPRAAQGANQPQQDMPQHESDQAQAQLSQLGTPQARPLSDALQHAGGPVDPAQSIVPQLMQPDSQHWPLTGDHSLLTGPVSQSVQPMPQSLGGLEGLNSDPLLQPFGSAVSDHFLPAQSPQLHAQQSSGQRLQEEMQQALSHPYQ